MKIKTAANHAQLQDFLVGLAKSNNYQVNYSGYLKPYTIAYVYENSFGFAAPTSIIDGSNAFKTVELFELIQVISKPATQNITYKLDGKEVIIRTDGSVTYGCTTLDKAQVDSIIDNRATLLKMNK